MTDLSHVGNMLDILGQKKKMTTSYIDDFIDSLNQDFSLPNKSIVDIFNFGIKPNEWAFYCLVESYNQNAVQVPPTSKLASIMNVTERNIHTITKEMKEKGLLVVTGGRNQRQYNFDMIKKIMRVN